MGDFEVVTVLDDLYPRGFRKVAAMLLIMGVTVIPSLNSWQNEPAERPGVSGLPTGRFAPAADFAGARGAESRFSECAVDEPQPCKRRALFRRFSLDAAGGLGACCTR